MVEMAEPYRPLPDGQRAALIRRQLPVDTEAEISCITRHSVANKTWRTNVKSLNPTDPNNIISNARNISRNKNMTVNRDDFGPQRTGDLVGFFGMIFEPDRRRLPIADDRGVGSMSLMLLPIGRHDRCALGLPVRSIPVPSLMRGVGGAQRRLSRIHPWMTGKLISTSSGPSSSSHGKVHV